ncbi:anti-sigma factor domain-containing protein [Egicoccus halophilus]|uniref:Anti-sigma-K factor RskA n=1 Tax=Egicoccus halophilus TaxID=1670830 RepID=A0A8J3ETE1_9ACTN|nr:anti-sigma factor [Egicoccus halophilus]GGI05021.1 hypothetical protein GCM10011354_12000 [Egicoccus halophilus]
MRGEHERYEELAVGHVLGGLDAGDAADFRSHLLGCRDCRLRVAELRDLAADLAAAEREERARAKVRTEVVRRDDVEDPEPAAATSRIGIRHVTVATIAVLLLAGAMGFWNLHLRTAAAAYAQAATYRGETLRLLAGGVSVPVDVAEDVTALVIVDGERVAFTVRDLPSLAEGERLEVWLIDGDEVVRAGPPVTEADLDDGALAGHVDDADAATLVVSRETGPYVGRPAGPELVRARLLAPA